MRTYFIYLLLLGISCIECGRGGGGGRRRHNHLSDSGSLKEPELSCSASSRSSRRCSRRQTVPTHAAGHPVITDIEDAVSPDCAAITVDCDPACPTCDKCSKYRTIDGTCNNLKETSSECRKLWGSINRPLVRLADSNYADGSSTPTSGLPSARTISNFLHRNTAPPTDPRFTLMLMQFGQFVDHDLSFTPEVNLDLEAGCCEDPAASPECFPITVPQPDPDFSAAETCKDLVRSAPHCSSGTVRQQFNAITAHLDGSQVYGSEDSLQPFLRSYEDGELRVASKGSKHYPPTVAPCGADTNTSTLGLQFQAGDRRATENPGLASLHTIFVREHNRVAAEIRREERSWGDEKVFQEARRLVVAELQNIIYSEYLPLVLGDNTLAHAADSEYDDTVDTSIHNVFATAAYRFGHSLVTAAVNMFPSSTYNLEDNFFNIDEVYENDNMDGILRGAAAQASEESDRFISSAVRSNLFRNVDPHGLGMDLAARNIQRGRDHGLATFATYREQVCGLGGAPAWQSASTSDLDTLYGAGQGYARLEIFPGGLLERVETGEVGPTFSCLIRRQFEALRTGDRFFFTHSNTGGCHEFSRRQQHHLMQRTLRDVICDNTEVDSLQARVMEQPDAATNPVTRCPASSSLDVKALLRTSERCCGGSSGGGSGGNKPNKGKGKGGKGGRH